MKKVAGQIVGALSSFSSPATDAALVALIVQLFPSVHFNIEELTAVLLGVGIVSSSLRTYFKL